MSKDSMKRAILAVSFLALATTALAAGFNAFMKIETVEGNSKDPGHSGWIELTTHHWGVVPGAAAPGCASQTLNFKMKAGSKAGEQLMKARAQGTVFKEATLDIGPEKHVLNKIRVVEARSERPIESFSINFAQCATHSKK